MLSHERTHETNGQAPCTSVAIEADVFLPLSLFIGFSGLALVGAEYVAGTYVLAIGNDPVLFIVFRMIPAFLWFTPDCGGAGLV